MNPIRSCLLVIAGCLLLARPALAGEAAETATFSYQRMYELLYQFQVMPREATDRLDFAIRLRDQDGETPPDLQVHIRFGRRVIEVPSDIFGILELPFSPQLASSNAPVITNQPADSMEMGLVIIIRSPRHQGRIDTEWLLEAIEQTNAVVSERARIAANLQPRAVGVTLKFAGESRGTVIIKGPQGEVEYRADEFNTVDIPLDRDRLPESIRVTEQPLVIFPLFRN